MPKPYRVIKWPNGRSFAIGVTPDKDIETNVARTYRTYFLVKITGSNAVVPFYISSGSGGKKDREGNLFGVDKAFPYWGFGDDGWQNKTGYTWEGEDPKYAIDTYYGMPLLKRIAEEIDIVWSKYGHNYRKHPLEKTTIRTKIEKKVNGELKRTIGITPLINTKTGLYGTEREFDFLNANIDVARKRIEGDVMLPIKRPPKKDKPKRLDSTFARAANTHEDVYGTDSSGEVNRTMYTWNPVLSINANHEAAAEAGAPRGPCWCGVYHDRRLNCPNREMYQLNKNYYTSQGDNNRAQVSN